MSNPLSMHLYPQATPIIVETPEIDQKKPSLFVNLKSRAISWGFIFFPHFCEGTAHISYLIKPLFCLLYSEAISFCEIKNKPKILSVAGM